MTVEARTLDKAAARKPDQLLGQDQLLGNIEPFFHTRPMTYVDVGAYTGGTFSEILRSGLRLRAAHLIEPNPTSFAALEQAVATLGAAETTRCYNLALSNEPGRLQLRDAANMSKVMTAEDAAAGPSFAAEATTLDLLAAGFAQPHISLLKVDVEGHELQVLAGATRLLERQAIDMIYIEAGMNPAGGQQTYYRRIEDLLRPYGYRLFRIYEQINEWQQDSPFLRRVNLAFMSETFAAKNPLHLSRELLALRRRRDQLQASLKEAQAAATASREASETRIGSLETELATARAAREAERAAREVERAARAAEAAEKAAQAAAAETARAEAEALRAELAALRERSAGLEDRLAETTRSLADREGEARESRRLQQELQRLQAYGRTLEGRHLQILRSSTWRAMEPARRTMRLLTGKKAPAQFKPILGRGGGAAGAKLPEAPAPKSPSGLSRKSRRAADELLRLAGKQDFVALVARERAFAGETPTDKTFFLERFCQLLALSSLSAYSEVARIADEIAARFGDQHSWLVRTFGAAAYDRFVAEAAMALTRVGRYAEAVPLIDGALERLDRPPAMLQLRAEVCWPYGAEQALADIAECQRKGGQNRFLILLQAYLESIVLGRDVALEERFGDHPQMTLVAASLALKQGDFDGYRRHLNGYFEGQGLLAPVPGAATRFAFADLVATGAEAGMQAGAGEPRRDGPLVSVIMTTYNSEETLDYAVASLRQQSHGNLEILIVDDGSTDGTRARLAALAAEDPRIRILLNDENLGTYCSKNRAIARAAGAYLTMHDSDDWAHPDRIARHVDFMESTPSLVASRSEWLRLEGDGMLNFRRWGRRFQHPNPASTFFRREVVEQIGFFDSVRFGADSEHWYRMRRVFGRARVKSLPLCLGFGSIRADSLTRSGSGAMDHENYSPVRGAYAASYFYWHATASPASMKLPPRARTRPFPAPPEMAVPAPEGEAEPVPSPAAPAAIRLAPGEPEFLFGISLASKQVAANWARTEELLGHTLRSVLNQSDPRFSVVICGHERPRLAELDDPRVLFVPSDNPPPGKASTSGFRGDKMRKRRIIGAILRQRGGGYFFPLDADDLVHRDVVAHVRKDDNRRGYLFEKGYALDYGNHNLAPVPGAWSASFDRSCGSSAVIHFTPEDLPLDSGMDEDLYFNLFQSHAYWPIVAEEFGRRLEPLPFPGGVYVVNHAENLSFRLQRKGIRTENIIRSIASHRLEEGDRVLAEEFGQP